MKKKEKFDQKKDKEKYHVEVLEEKNEKKTIYRYTWFKMKKKR